MGHARRCARVSSGAVQGLSGDLAHPERDRASSLYGRFIYAYAWHSFLPLFCP
jgi:hypothetical protein